MSAVLDFAQKVYAHPTGRKAVRYSMVSAVSVVVSQAVLFLSFGVERLASAVWCNLLATVVATPIAYYLNRQWAWGKSGQSHFLREVLPFWVISFAGLALSLGTVALAARWGKSVAASHLELAVIVNSASLFAYGVLWVGKFLLFDRLLFVERAPAPADAR